MNRAARTITVAITAAIAVVVAGASGGCDESSRRPIDDTPATRAATSNASRSVPAHYVLVGPAGATAFASLPTGAADTRQGTRLGPGFGFAVTEERSVGNRRYVHIHDGRWLPGADVARAHPSTFVGSRIAPGETMRLAWVIKSEARVYASPDSGARAVTTREPHARVTLTGACQSGWCPLTAGWMRAADLAIPTVTPRPGRTGPRDRWLDIDLTSQTLVAYEGDQPVYATLISGGIGQRDSPLATPLGVFTILSKHDLVRMDNLEHTGVVPYAYDVPLAQYFNDGKALHAALWHDRFGHPTSHGCVNLAPRDAEWLFAFTKPALFPGTSVVSATAVSPGTVLRIRGDLPTVAARDQPSFSSGRAGEGVGSAHPFPR